MVKQVEQQQQQQKSTFTFLEIILDAINCQWAKKTNNTNKRTNKNKSTRHIQTH